MPIFGANILIWLIYRYLGRCIWSRQCVWVCESRKSDHQPSVYVFVFRKLNYGRIKTLDESHLRAHVCGRQLNFRKDNFQSVLIMYSHSQAIHINLIHSFILWTRPHKFTRTTIKRCYDATFCLNRHRRFWFILFPHLNHLVVSRCLFSSHTVSPVKTQNAYLSKLHMRRYQDDGKMLNTHCVLFGA